MNNRPIKEPLYRPTRTVQTTRNRPKRLFVVPRSKMRKLNSLPIQSWTLGLYIIIINSSYTL